MIIREKLRRLRKQLHLNQTELAHACGVPANRIQRVEQIGQSPKGSDALAIARTLGVSVDYLLDDSLPFPPPEEGLLDKVITIHALEGQVAALTARLAEVTPGPTPEAPPGAPPARAATPEAAPGAPAATAAPPLAPPDVVHLPILKLGAGFDISLDAAGRAFGALSREGYFSGLGRGRFFAAELHTSSMSGPGGAGFAFGDVLVFQIITPAEIETGDYLFVRAHSQALFRQAFPHDDKVRLRAFNPADPELLLDPAGIEAAARLVKLVRDY